MQHSHPEVVGFLLSLGSAGQRSMYSRGICLLSRERLATSAHVTHARSISLIASVKPPSGMRLA